MEYHHLRQLKKEHPSLLLLNARNAPLIVAFLNKAFKTSNRSTIPEDQLTDWLDDFMFDLSDSEEPAEPDKTSKRYLEQWTESGWLRRFYPEHGEEPHYDLTPETEKVFEWIKDLKRREFVGAESRLQSLFFMLRELKHDTNEDPQEKIAQLEQEKERIDSEIERIRKNGVERMNPTQVIERFRNIEETAYRLINDFRQVEDNFRQLDQQARERIILSEFGKGKLLAEVLTHYDNIGESDQGRSFKAFFDLLISQNRQDELEEMLSNISLLPEITGLDEKDWIHRFKNDLVSAGDRVNRTSQSLIRQLRQFLDDRTYMENRRIMDLIKEIETKAIELKESPPAEKDFWELAMEPLTSLPCSRKLWFPNPQPVIGPEPLTTGTADVDTTSLYSQLYVDSEELRSNIRQLLQSRQQVSLRDVTTEYPIQKGLAELVTYFDIASKDERAVISTSDNEVIAVLNESRSAFVRMPKVIFCR